MPMMAATSTRMLPSSRPGGLSLIEPHHRHVVLDRYSGPEAPRKSIDPRQRALRDVAAGEHGPATLWARAAMAEVERMKPHRRKRAVAKLAFSRQPFPEFRRSRKAALAPIGASIEEISGRRLMRQAEPLISLCRKYLDGVVLEDEIAKAVKDRLAAIDLDAKREMRSMARHHIGTGVDRGARELDVEVGHLLHADVRRGGQAAAGAEFMAVKREDHPVGLPACLLDLPQDRVGILAIDPGRHLEAVASAKLAPHEGELVIRVARCLLGAEECRAVAGAFGSEPELVAAAFELGKHCSVDGVTGGEAERIDARPSWRIGPLGGGAIPRPEERSRGHKPDATGARIRIGRHARLGQVRARARARQTSRLDVPERGDEATSAVVGGVVV